MFAKPAGFIQIIIETVIFNMHSFTALIFLVASFSNGHVNGQEFPIFTNLSFLNLLNMAKLPPLPNLDVLKDVPGFTIDKILDGLLEGTDQLDEEAFLALIQAKVLVDMTRKCDCENLQSIDEMLSKYYSYDENVVDNANEEQPGSDLKGK